MTNRAAAEKLAMARRIAQKVVADRNMQRDNGLVYSAALEAALAAIEECSEMYAQMAERLRDSITPNNPWCEAQHVAFDEIARLSREFDHLKGSRADHLPPPASPKGIPNDR